MGNERESAWGTNIGGLRRDFPSTCWSLLVRSVGKDAEAARARLDELARNYWKPVYCFVRSKWRRSSEDAKDLVQDFFLWLIEGDFLGRVDRSRGRFRTFIMVALDHYMIDDYRRRRSLKRGGGRTFLTVESSADGDPPLEVPDPRGRTPEDILDDEWRKQILELALARLEALYREEGREAYFRIFHQFHGEEGEKKTYEDLASQYGIRPTDVSNYLVHVRRRFQSVVKDVIAETVEGEEDLQTELRWMFGKEAP